MPEYLRPDVYIERPATGSRTILSVSTSVGAMLGVAKSGPIDEAILCTNWTEFIDTYALGVANPFDANHLATSVYGFFQNGGTMLYVARVTDGTGVKATATSTTFTATAKYVGTWGNSIIVDAIGSGTFTINVYYGTQTADNLVETFEEVTAVGDVESAYVVLSGTIVDATLTLTTGADGGTVDAADYITALQLFNGKPINMIAAPGIPVGDLLTDMKSYIEGRGGDCFYIADTASGLAPGSITTPYTPATKYAAVYYPWIKILDPTVSGTSTLRLSPPSGHVMGMFARTDYARGVHKAPAGEEAILNGVYALERELTPGNVSLLNPLKICCILNKPSVGFCVWGARTLSTDSTFRYVSDSRYAIKVETSVKQGTQWAVFEPIADDLFARVSDTIWSYLFTEWSDEKALFGLTPAEAFYVKCDRELNTSATIAQGKLIVEFGYANKKPAEFVIIRIMQMPAEPAV